MVTFDRNSFKKPPRIWMALSGMGSYTKYLAISLAVKKNSVTTTGFEYEVTSTSEECDYWVAYWIAIEIE